MKIASNRSVKAAGLVALVLLIVWQHVQAVKLGYAVEKARRQERVLRGQIAERELELERSLSPVTLAAHARVKLGMVPAIPESLRILGAPPKNPEEQGWVARFLSRNFAG